jgi:putative sugar O-methyltransferase
MPDGKSRTARTPKGPQQANTAASLAPRWEQLTQRTLTELDACDPAFRPTNFWGPGVERLLGEMRTRGLESLKAWPEALFWFYPVYELSLRRPQRRKLLDLAESFSPSSRKQLRARLDGVSAARRDFDAARLAWDHDRWPADLEAHGESRVGRPRHLFHLTGGDVAWGRPYLNYLLCLAALSRHVRSAPKSFLELGGGFGVLGEIVMSRDPDARYVNCDIPPLLTVASYYLTTLFGDDRVLTYDDRVPSSGTVEVPGSACLPNWRIGDVEGPFDVFVNSFSFQEMEPEVVQRYVDTVVGLGVSYVVSLNSRKGKHVAQDEADIGVLDPVTSSRIVAMFEAHGYKLCGAYNSPLVAGAGELVVLSRI